MLGYATALALALALASGAASAQTSPAGVTTNGYGASNTGSDITTTCKKLKVDTSGSVSGTCNKWVGGTTGMTYVGTSVSVSGNIHCVAMGQASYIAWGSTQSTHWSPGSWEVKLNSTGTKYLITAKCSSIGGATASRSSLDLGDSTNGVENDGGSLSF